MNLLFKNFKKTHLTALAVLGIASTVFVFSCKKANEQPASLNSPEKLQATAPENAIFNEGVYTAGDYKLNFIDSVPGGFNTEVREKMISTFFTVYTQMANRFNPNTAKTVTFHMDPTYTGVASTSGTVVRFNPSYMGKQPYDIDVVTHEAMHIAQAYGNTNTPWWVIEGIADYVRYTYGMYNKEAGWELPDYSSGQSYTNGYRVSARFLLWLQERYTSNIVDQLNTASRNNQYTANIWVSLTGKTLEQLWSHYTQSPSIKGTDITSSSTITVSKENSAGANGNEGSLKLIDNNINTKFFVSYFSNGFWLKLDLPEASIVTSYTLTSGNDQADRDPKSWTLKGSNDNTNWTTLDNQTNQAFATRKLKKMYSFPNTTAFKYYKLTINANNGSRDFQLAEWRIFKY